MKYYEEIPIIRSIATMLVVLVHVTSRIYYANGEFTNHVIGYFNQFSRLGTPIFAVISGFLLTISTLKRPFDLNYFIKSRFTKILLPFIIWTTLYIILSFSFDETFNSLSNNIINTYLLGSGETHLYFILVVIEFYILFPLLQKISSGKPIVILYVLATILNIFWFYFGNGLFQFKNDIINTFINSRIFILNWISFFVLGILFAKHYENVNKLIIKYKKVIITISIILFINLYITIDLENLISSSTSIMLINIPIFITVLMYFYKTIKNSKLLMEIFTKIGNFSMGIYLVHLIVIMLYRRIFNSIVFNNSATFILSYIIILLASIIIVELISRLPFANYIIPIPKRKKNNPERLYTTMYN